MSTILGFVIGELAFCLPAIVGISYLRGYEAWGQFRLPPKLRMSPESARQLYIIISVIFTIWLSVVLIVERNVIDARRRITSDLQESMLKLQAQADALQVEQAGTNAEYRSETSFRAGLSRLIREACDLVTVGLTEANTVTIGELGLSYSGNGVWTESDRWHQYVGQVQRHSAELAIRVEHIVRDLKAASNVYSSQMADLKSSVPTFLSWNSLISWKGFTAIFFSGMAIQIILIPFLTSLLGKQNPTETTLPMQIYLFVLLFGSLCMPFIFPRLDPIVFVLAGISVGYGVFVGVVDQMIRQYARGSKWYPTYLCVAFSILVLFFIAVSRWNGLPFVETLVCLPSIGLAGFGLGVIVGTAFATKQTN